VSHRRAPRKRDETLREWLTPENGNRYVTRTEMRFFLDRTVEMLEERARRRTALGWLSIKGGDLVLWFKNRRMAKARAKADTLPPAAA
jgi:hypothetical protein